MANAELPILTGLLCGNGNYISQEKFGNTLNASAAHMRSKQIFAIVSQGDGNKVAIRTPNGKYVTAVLAGEVTGDAEAVGDDQKFDLEVQSDGSWAFKSAHGYYLDSEKADQVYCKARSVGANQQFKIHLAMHPQITIYSPARKSYVHLKDGELQVNEKLPWGYDAMVTCDFNKATAKYSIRAANNKYWSSAGKLVDASDASCEYVIELIGGKMAFKGSNGKYLSAPTAKNQIFHCEGSSAGVAELFVFEDSHGQVAIHADGKYMSVIKGDPGVHGTSVADTEIFQMEINDKGQWAFRTNGDEYLKVSSGLAKTKSKSDATFFDLEYDGASVTIKDNGTSLSVKGNGNCVFGSEGTKFFFDIINRPQLYLRTDFGFVTGARSTVACNAAEPATFLVTAKNGTLQFKADNGKYIVSNADGSLAATGDAGEDFSVEWRVHTKFAIQCLKTKTYLANSQDGKVLTTANKDNASLFEY